MENGVSRTKFLNALGNGNATESGQISRLARYINLVCPIASEEQKKRLAGLFTAPFEETCIQRSLLKDASGRGLLFPSEICLLKGKQKTGKSHAAIALAASVLGCKDFGYTATEPENAKVIYFDTEQSRKTVVLLHKKVYALLGWDTEQPRGNFAAVSLRVGEGADLPTWRQKQIEEICGLLSPTFVIVDGLVDVVPGCSFNDVEKSSEAVSFLLNLASKFDCTVATILHTNKADENSRGHAGSICEQKAAEIWQIEKKKGDIFQLSQVLSRFAPVEGFSFTLDKEGLPRPKARQKAPEGPDELQILALAVLQREEKLSYSLLRDRIQAVEGCKETKAKDLINALISSGKVAKDATKNGKSSYYRVV